MQQTENGYWYRVDELPRLLEARFYPEQPIKESAIIRDWLAAHGLEYERFGFSVRVGVGATADPTHLPEIQALAKWLYKKRIDVVAIAGQSVTIVEAKDRVTATLLGQLHAYETLWQDEHPEFPAPKLLAIGRWADPDVLRVCSAHGIDVLLYEDAGVS